MNKTETIILRSFGRRRGRKLRKSRNALYETLLPRLLIDIDKLQVASGKWQESQPTWLEIGFGAGEHLAEQAKQNLHVQFIGCEPYINGIASLLSDIDKHQIANIRLYDNDARFLLEKLPDHSLEKIFLLFPDPWPKARHHKKRIVSPNTLALFHRKMKQGGLLRLVTDHTDYGVWMLENLLAFGQFEWQAASKAGWSVPPADWVRTRYQAKAEAEGRGAVYLDWVAK